MNDPTTIWQIMRDIVSSVGVIIAVIISIVSLVKTSRQKQNDQLDSIQKSLTEHILEDEHSITELQTNVKNLTDNVNGKLDTIIRELDK